MCALNLFHFKSLLPSHEYPHGKLFLQAQTITHHKCTQKSSKVALQEADAFAVLYLLMMLRPTLHGTFRRRPRCVVKETGE